MNEADYYLLNGDQEQGPWTLTQLQEFLRVRSVTLDTLYARPGMSEWKALASLFGAASPAAPSAKQNAAKRKKPAAVVVDISSVVQQVARDVEAGLFDDLAQAEYAKPGWMWLAVETDKETCEQCQFYDGQRWTHDWKPVAGGSEFPGKPPLHKGCRCALVEVDLDAKTPKWFKLDDVLKKENRNVLESVHGKAATDAYFKGDIDAKQLLRQGVKLSPDEFSELRSAYEKELRRGEK